MQIKQYRYGDTNLAYLLWSGNEAAAIDGGAVDRILDTIETEGLELKWVLNTHDHWDHVPGNEDLLKRSSAALVSPDEMCGLKVLKLGNSRIEAFPTPGHTADSIVFYFNDGKNDCLITGDTMFNGTVGNCYTKNYELYFESLQKVLRFPPGTRIYAGHDIFDYATGVINEIDPANPLLTEYMALYSNELLFTSLEIEKAVNPFIRFDDPALDSFRTDLGLPVDTSFLRFRAMMTIH